MIKSRLFMLAAVLIAAGGALQGCADSFRANVTRFHNTLPPPEQGATFAIRADDPRNDRSLEFAHYADLVAGRLTALGYTAPPIRRAPGWWSGSATMSTEATERVVTSYSPAGHVRPGHLPRRRAGRNGPRVRYVVGYRDPFLWGSGWG